MSILVGPQTRLLVQGITGREGDFHSRAMLEYGTQIVAGVTPGKGGQSAVDGRVPVFDTVVDAVAETGANAACIFVPAPYAPDAILEAADAGIPLVICITEGIPALDMLRVHYLLRAQGVRLIGPNCPGATTVGSAKVGIIPGDIHRPGPVGLVSRSGTLTYEVVQAMTDAGVGQTTCVGIGGDPIVGTTFIDVLEMFNADPETEAIVLIGEIGGDEEERAADYCAREVRKPMAAFIAGRNHLGRRRHGGVEAPGAPGGRHPGRGLTLPDSRPAPRSGGPLAAGLLALLRGRLKQLPQHPVQGPRMDERHLAMGARTWLPVDELGLCRQKHLEVAGQVVAGEADVVQTLATGRQEAGHAALVIGGLDQLDLGASPGGRKQEAEARVLRGEAAGRVDGLPTEEGPIARERLVDRAHHDGDVVDRSNRHGRYSPQVRRSVSLISPRVTCASTQARMRGTTFSVPAAATSSAADASATRAGSRPARTACVRATCSASAAGSITWACGRCSSPPSAKAFTPTTIRSPASIARWAT
jgi:succinyl-CoA synthetase alpha subunit